MRKLISLFIGVVVLLVPVAMADAGVPGTSQPDAHIRVKGKVWKGDGVYGTKPIGQTATVRSARGKAVTFEVVAENDGSITAEIGTEGLCVFARFQNDNSGDVSGTVHAGYWKGTLDPDESLSSLFVILKIPKNFVGKSASCKLVFRSEFGEKDAIKAQVLAR